MHKYPMNVGPANEKLDWLLVSQHSKAGDTISEYEALSELFDKTYHATVKIGDSGWHYHHIF
ncbi:hypothetical protein D7Y05_08225 [bacterium 1XD42-54]|nr:hypothetical protein D7Y05_08225 [bacterium 1XD42-54]